MTLRRKYNGAKHGTEALNWIAFCFPAVAVVARMRERVVPVGAVRARMRKRVVPVGAMRARMRKRVVPVGAVRALQAA